MTTGQAQVKAASGKGQSCAHKRGRNLGLMNLHKLTFGTPFPLGTLDTVTLAKCRQMLQFIVSSLNYKMPPDKKPSKNMKERQIAKTGYLECVKGKRVTTEEPFPPFHFFTCWKFHPSKPYFHVESFALMPPPQRPAAWATDSRASAQRKELPVKTPPQSCSRLNNIIGSSDPS